MCQLPNKSGTIALTSDIVNEGGVSQSTVSSMLSLFGRDLTFADISIVYKIGNNESISGVFDLSFIGFVERGMCNELADIISNWNTNTTQTEFIQRFIKTYLDTPNSQDWVSTAVSNGENKGPSGGSRIGTIVSTKGNILLSDGKQAIVTSVHFPTFNYGRVNITYVDYTGQIYNASLAWDNFIFVGGYINTTFKRS